MYLVSTAPAGDWAVSRRRRRGIASTRGGEKLQQICAP